MIADGYDRIAHDAASRAFGRRDIAARFGHVRYTPVAELRFRFSHLVLEAITCSGVRSNAQEEFGTAGRGRVRPEQGDTHENRRSSARIECTGIDHRPH